jgi:hypothetical protein
MTDGCQYIGVAAFHTPKGYQDSAQGGGFAEPCEQRFDTRSDFRVRSPTTRVPLLRCSKLLIDT